MTKATSFKIEYVQYMDAAGEAVKKLPEFAQNKQKMLDFYRAMLLLRTLDNKAVAMQRTGKMSTYPTSTGQEAVGVGAGSALRFEDVLVPYYRGTGTLIEHGVQAHEVLLYWGGDERGSDFKFARQDFPIAVPIATQNLHAAGVAMAIKLRKQSRAVLTEIGEGGTSKGDFYESINVAGIWNLPLVTLINNNQWAISVPSKIQTACKTFAQKAIAAGIEGIVVDGNDVIAVHQVVGAALDKARQGGGATLIEAVTYRLGDHTTADDAKRYRDEQAHKQALDKEPIKRFKTWLSKQGMISPADDLALQQSCTEQVEKEVQIYLNMPKRKPEFMFSHLYATLPERLVSQVQQVSAGGKS